MKAKNITSSIAVILILLTVFSRAVSADVVYSIRVETSYEKAVFALSYSGEVTGMAIVSPSGVTYSESSAGSAYKATTGSIKIGISYPEVGRWGVTIYGDPGTSVNLVYSSDTTFGNYASGGSAPSDPPATTAAPTKVPTPTVTPTPKPIATPAPTATPETTPVATTTATTSATPTLKPSVAPTYPTQTTKATETAVTTTETAQETTETLPVVPAEITDVPTATPEPTKPQTKESRIDPASPENPELAQSKAFAPDWRMIGIWTFLLLAIVSFAIFFFAIRQQILDRILAIRIAFGSKKAKRQEDKLAKRALQAETALPVVDLAKKKEELLKVKLQQKELKKLEAERKREEKARAKAEADRRAAEIRAQQIALETERRAAATKAAEEERIRKAEEEEKRQIEIEKSRIDAERRIAEETARLEAVKQAKEAEEARLSEIRAKTAEPDPTPGKSFPFWKKQDVVFTPVQLEIMRRYQTEVSEWEQREKEQRKEGEKQ